MGDLIRFRPRHGAKTDLDTARPEGGSAAILLFTGVRYERQGNTVPAKSPRPAGKGGRRKRA